VSMHVGSYRVELDIVGEANVPAEAYYGVHTVRAIQNFPITGQRLRPEMIRGIALIKKAAAMTFKDAGSLDSITADAIIAACDDVMAGLLDDQFPIDPIQGGAGTSVNMNANEVIANRAIELLGGQKGDYSHVHPNDHVNCGQSTNDVFPSCGKLAAVWMMKPLLATLAALRGALEEKSHEFDGVVKIGRTQLQDAVPIRLGQEFHAYAAVIGRDISRLQTAQNELRTLNLGGTAIGTGVNASNAYTLHIVERVCQLCGEPFEQAEDLIDSTQNLDCYVRLSSALKACAVNLSKISNDLRLMSSGPRAGFGEITLPARQSGSSIMPGKVNPVIPEVVNQIAFCVIGNDMTITMAAEAGQLELNAFEPVIFYKLFDSITAMTNGVQTLTDHCVSGITANEDRCRQMVSESSGVAAALCPYIGYVHASQLAKEALNTHSTVETLALRDGLIPEAQLHALMDPYAMTVSPAARPSSCTAGKAEIQRSGS
jgi:aspartate ammonia-lyase